jgi:hypothetical protein
LHRVFIFQGSCPGQIDKNINIFRSYLHSNKAFMVFGIAYFSENWHLATRAGFGRAGFGLWALGFGSEITITVIEVK